MKAYRACGGLARDKETFYLSPCFNTNLLRVAQYLVPISFGQGKSNGRNCSANPASARQYAVASGTVEILTGQYLYGQGPSNRTFGPNSAISQVMARSAGVTSILNDYYMLGQTTNLYTFGAQGYVSAGLNPAAQFVGSFRSTITPVTGGINLSLSNYTSVHSLTNGLIGSHPRSSFGPLGTIQQTYNVFVPCS